MRRKSARQKYSKKVKKRFFNALLLFLVAIVVFGLLIFARRSSKLISSNMRKNIVLHTSPVILLSLPSKDEEKGVIVTIPADVYAPVPYGYGPYSLESIWRLASLEKKPDLFAQSISDLLGLQIDSWIGKDKIQNLDTQSSVSLIEKIGSTFSFVSLISPGYQSNLSFVDRIYLGWKIFNLRPDTFFVYETNQNPKYFKQEKLPNKDNITVVDEGLMDEFLAQKFADFEIRQEKLQIEILNTTDAAGIGKQFSRYISNIGGKVVSINNDDRQVANCLIEVKEEYLHKKLIDYLLAYFGCETKTLADTETAGVVILLGDDFSQRWQSSF